MKIININRIRMKKNEIPQIKSNNLTSLNDFQKNHKTERRKKCVKSSLNFPKKEVKTNLLHCSNTIYMTQNQAKNPKNNET